MDGVTVIPDIATAFHGEDDVPDELYHPETGELVARVEYVRLDAWRGYYEAAPVDGWTKVGEGCNCGDWGDTPAGMSSQECEAQVEALASEHGDVLLILGGSSNVFAMPFDVLARA